MSRAAGNWIGMLDKKTAARSIPAVLKALAGRQVPLRVTHCITYRCNLDCDYCARHGIQVEELSTDEIKRTMRTLRSAGARFWSFNGGEALIREDLGDLLSYGKSIGMVMSFATNGTLVSEKVEDLREAALVSVSLDGPKEVQDAARGVSYDRLIEGLEAMAVRGIDFSLFSVIGNHNIDVLAKVIDLAEYYGTVAFFQPVRIQKEDIFEKSTAYFPETRRMRDAVACLIEEKKRGRPVASSREYLDTIGRCWPDKMPGVECFGGRLFCFITPEGHVTRCCDTLRWAPGTPGTDLMKYGADALGKIPPCDCTTCYSSLPLEANLLLTALRRNPLAVAGKVLSDLLFQGRIGS